MKKYLLILLSILFFTKPTGAEMKKEVVIFSQPCYFCEKMKEALDGGIISANPDNKFTILDVHDEKNSKLLRRLAQEHDLHGSIGTPLLFIGKNYMMGWGEDAGKQLQTYIDELRTEKLSRIPVQSLK